MIYIVDLITRENGVLTSHKVDAKGPREAVAEAAKARPDCCAEGVYADAANAEYLLANICEGCGAVLLHPSEYRTNDDGRWCLKCCEEEAAEA